MAKLEGESPTDIDKYADKSSDDVRFDDGDIATQAPQGHGKTTLAATRSDFCPPELAEGKPAKKKSILADMGWIAFDRGAVSGFAELNLQLPKGHYIDADRIMGDMGPTDGIKTIGDLVDKMVDGGVKIVVVDTVSSWDKVLNGHFQRVYADDDNTQKMFQEIFAYHKRLRDELRTFPVQLINLFHSEATPKPRDTQGQRIQEATRPAEYDAIRPEITGKGRGVWLNHCSLRGVILASKDLDAKEEREKRPMRRVFLPFGGKGFEGGGRFSQALDAEERPHLGLIRQKILNFKPATEEAVPTPVGKGKKK